ncbi:hypothetical protein [Nonomuraea sp. SBT364]|uniref:hypothetical protein n=1 Tax=Nonomuraea sp. SBT364 TaxID=1580530 RepID=UPI00069D3CB3|nr:hypothetical protein [Nonomuraea sp. SBT364]
MDGSASRDRRRTSTVRRLLSATLGLLAMIFLVAPPAGALALPTPGQFVSNLDLECFKTSPYQPPAVGLTLRHINPVLSDLPTVQVSLGQRDQLCVPVAKNNVIPPRGTLDFVRFVDLSCYRVTGFSADKPLVLSHLNPVLRDLPRKEIRLTRPEQLCVPVAKNGVLPPAEVLRVVRHIDLLCFGATPNVPMGRPLTLQQLNPVLVGKIPTADVRVDYSRQLCVPVYKGGDSIPPEVLDIVRWIDLEKYDITAREMAPVDLTLRHLNPVLARLPEERATLTAAVQLGVPVAKDGRIPPG